MRTTDLLEGLAQHLAYADIGLTWAPTGIYTPDETGIVIGPVPAQPDQVVALAPYDINEYTQGVQIRTRHTPGDPRPALDLADEMYRVLHGAQMVRLGPVLVSLIWRTSVADLGPDTNRRPETSSNWALVCARPSDHTE